MASAELSCRVKKVVGYAPLCEMGAEQRREFQEALLDAGGFEDLPGKWQAAIVGAEQNRPDFRIARKRLSAGPLRSSTVQSLLAQSNTQRRQAHLLRDARRCIIPGPARP